MNRYVVFREYVGLDVFYAEAESPQDAQDKVLPDPAGIELVDWGDEYAPYLSAYIREVALRAYPIRRFPPRVWVLSGAHGEHRDVGSQGEPPRRGGRSDE